jgi:hypothetical protein
VWSRTEIALELRLLEQSVEEGTQRRFEFLAVVQRQIRRSNIRLRPTCTRAERRADRPRYQRDRRDRR